MQTLKFYLTVTADLKNGQVESKIVASCYTCYTWVKKHVLTKCFCEFPIWV